MFTTQTDKSVLIAINEKGMYLIDQEESVSEMSQPQVLINRLKTFISDFNLGTPLRGIVLGLWPTKYR